MKILVAMPHFFDAAIKSGYGSTSSAASDRLAALTACLRGLQESVGQRQASLLSMHANSGGRTNGRFAKVNEFAAKQMDIAICTTGKSHLVGKGLPLAIGFHHVTTSVAPMLLGFYCHQVLANNLGKYDYYCYMEDDLFLSDPLFFVKLKWFSESFGNKCLLQPHRYETAGLGPLRKLYIDGPVKNDFTARWQDVSENPQLAGNVLGAEMVFERTPNPHAGCFFLNAAQMEIWAHTSHFLDGDTSFAGPLESAATLGVMKTFRAYKPALPCAGFLEIRHISNRYLGKRLMVK